MKVEILRSVAGANFSYSRGTADVPNDIARGLIKAGHAKPVSRPAPQKVETASTEPSEKAATLTGKKKGRTKSGGEK